MDKNKLPGTILFSILILMTACSMTDVAADHKKANENTAPANTSANSGKNVENQAAQNVQTKEIELFDGRRGKIENTKPSAAETALVEKEVRLKSQEEFLKKRLEGLAGNVDWEREFSVDGAAEGSFTRANSKQKAVLYRFSYTNGLVILEDGKIVAHFSGGPGDYAFYFAIRVLPDINQNGLSEIVLFRNVEDNDDVIAYLFESKNDGMRFLGEAKYFTSSYTAGDAADSKKAKQTAYRLTVQPSVKPAFIQELYERAGGKAGWILNKTDKRISLDKTVEAELTNLR